MHGVTLEDALLGLSVCRNQKLANIFYRLNLIEAYGTGMRKIHSAYKDCSASPEIVATANRTLKRMLADILIAVAGKGQNTKYVRYGNGRG